MTFLLLTWNAQLRFYDNCSYRTSYNAQAWTVACSWSPSACQHKTNSHLDHCALCYCFVCCWRLTFYLVPCLGGKGCSLHMVIRLNRFLSSIASGNESLAHPTLVTQEVRLRGWRSWKVAEVWSLVWEQLNSKGMVATTWRRSLLS